jgi:hypothetical protein
MQPMMDPYLEEMKTNQEMLMEKADAKAEAHQEKTEA